MKDSILFTCNSIEYSLEKLKEELTEEQYKKVLDMISEENYEFENLINILPSLDSGEGTISALNSNIKKLRLENGLTQSDVANVLNISQREYWRLEQEGFNPNFSRLALLALFYNVSLDWLSGLCKERKPFGIYSEHTKNYINGYCLDDIKKKNKMTYKKNTKSQD